MNAASFSGLEFVGLAEPHGVKDLQETGKTARVAQHILEEIEAPQIEVFPKEDRLDGHMWHENFINAPLFGPLVLHGRTAFVNPRDFRPYSNQWEFLESVERSLLFCGLHQAGALRTGGAQVVGCRRRVRAHIELGRVRNRENRDLKTLESNRRLEIRPSMRHILEAQRRLAEFFKSEYVFLNTKGLPCVQETFRGTG